MEMDIERKHIHITKLRKPCDIHIDIHKLYILKHIFDPPKDSFYISYKRLIESRFCKIIFNDDIKYINELYKIREVQEIVIAIFDHDSIPEDARRLILMDISNIPETFEDISSKLAVLISELTVKYVLSCKQYNRFNKRKAIYEKFTII